ncbi:hypothetical protein CC1G_08015 [Coprinopsis cinerea okayama7|uniref:Uncharacterized protein n=1 Tax=Coprinopsis cinerea (strain Okayama-7 / 130 / ATCC MYA-4618 / FGSC 9003) TaxID=240176 RepID=A8NQ98_COPC7|nr:hypothetical protein CC1G_08015 [Coprinopsis cinerea okayama7\|eukprot:XP_001835506.2 hypothetical protein CC1G_08015 [Coprinopsis cinerea okayama7\
MLCGLPLPLFSRKAKRERPIISAPIPQDTSRMSAWRNQLAEAGNKSDSNNALYAVPNPNGSAGKILLERPVSPQTSPPLDDDFDAYTQTGIGTYARGVGDHSRSFGHYQQQQQPARIPATSSPHRRPGIDSIDTFYGGHNQSHLAANTSSNHHNVTTSPKQRSSPVRHHDVAGANVDRSGSHRDHHRPASPRHNPNGGNNNNNNNSTPNSSRSKGKGRQDPTADYAEYQAYMKEMEKMFGKHGDLDVSLNRVKDPRSGTRESLTIGRVQMKNNGAAPSRGNSTSRRHPGSSPPFILSKTLPSGKVSRHASSNENGNRPPRARQDFEETSRRVIESTPDKTVTISTWREQVAKEADDAVERVSVYYVSGDVGTEMLENARGELDGFGAGTRSGSGSGNGAGVATGALGLVAKHNSMDRSKERVASPPVSQQVSQREPSHEGHHSITRESTQSHRNESQGHSRAAPSWIRPSQYLPNPLIIPNYDKSNSLESTSSSSAGPSTTSSSDPASRELYPPTPPPKPTTRLHSFKPDPMQSTPIDTRLDMPSFHPTQDGSLISTILKTSGSSSPHSSAGLEEVLRTCRPPLVHLMPMLAQLGITTKEHLDAMATFDAETRDRELKEEALRIGITIMEWAALMNKLKHLKPY